MKSEFFSDLFDPELSFVLQEKSEESVPDATITQEGYKIVVETKMSDWFYSEQLIKHLKSFGDVKNKVLITLAPEPMSEDKLADFNGKLKEYNANEKYPVLHINTTFETLANAVQEVIDDRDYEMQDILNDYLDYCYKDGLIPVSDAWKYMRMQLAGQTFKFNIRENLYYDNAERGFMPHDYLGLYTNKSVRAIGKICARIVTTNTENGLDFETEYGELTDERKQKIYWAIDDAISYGYDLRSVKQRYFFVEQFFETDFKKITPRPPMGTRIFDLAQVLNTETLPKTSEIAELLKTKDWS